MGLFTTAKKVGTGLLDMDKPSRMARSVDQGYNTDVYHGSTHNLTNMDALKTNIESDWGQGIYSSNNIDDVNANYAGIGPDLTSRIDRRMDDIDSRIDGYEFEDLINAFPEMTEKEAKSIASGNSEVFDTFKRRVATKEIAGPNSGVVYPLKLKTEDYAVIDIKNPTRIEGRDYYAEAADDLNRSDFGSDDDYEDALYELADDFRASDYDSPLETISQTLRDSGADDYTIEEIIQKVSDADSISAFDLDLAIREAEIYAYDDELGNMIPNGAISAQVFRDLGYKGVKDNTVNAKFPTMEGMNRDTTHYITFPQNEQTIRSVNAKFDPAKSNSTSLLASNPVATAAGLGGILAMTGSDDSYAVGPESQYDPTSMSGVLGISPEMIEAMAQKDALDQQRMAADQQRYGQYADDQMMPREQTYSEQLGNYLANLSYGDDSNKSQQRFAQSISGILDFTPVGSADALKLGVRQKEAGNTAEGWLNSILGASEAAIPAAGLGYKYGKKALQGLMEKF